jgi:hypothetical protein
MNPSNNLEKEISSKGKCYFVDQVAATSTVVMPFILVVSDSFRNQ